MGGIFGQVNFKLIAIKVYLVLSGNENYFQNFFFMFRFKCILIIWFVCSCLTISARFDGNRIKIELKDTFCIVDFQ